MPIYSGRFRKLGQVGQEEGVKDVEKFDNANTEKLCGSIICGCSSASFVSLGGHLFLPRSCMQDDQVAAERRSFMAVAYSGLFNFSEREVKQLATNETPIYSRRFQKLGQVGQGECGK